MSCKKKRETKKHEAQYRETIQRSCLFRECHEANGVIEREARIEFSKGVGIQRAILLVGCIVPPGCLMRGWGERVIEGFPDHPCERREGAPTGTGHRGWIRCLRGFLVLRQGHNSCFVCLSQHLGPFSPSVSSLFPDSIQTEQNGVRDRRRCLRLLGLLEGVVTVGGSSRREHAPIHPTEGPGCSR